MRFFVCIIAFVLFSCSDNKRQRETESYFKNELAWREQELNKIFSKNDSVKLNVKEIESEINKLILLSKDVENLKASISLSKEYFDKLSLQYQLNRSDFIDIGPGMTPEEIEVSLRSNQVNLYNQLILKYSNGKTPLFTAH